MRDWWPRLLAGFGVVIFIAGSYVAPYVASQAGTHAAIRSAQAAAANSKAEKQQLQGLTQAEANIQQVVDFIKSVQTGPQASAARTATAFYVAEFEAICAAVHCHPAR